MPRLLHPESSDPRDVAAFVDVRINEMERRFTDHIDERMDELRTIFLSGFPDSDPTLHREYHREQIEMMRARKQFYRGLLEKSVWGLVLWGVPALGAAIMYYLRYVLNKGPG